MSLFAAMLAVYRMFHVVTISSLGHAINVQLRRQFLLGFSLYMAGAGMRELIVMAAGMTAWDDTAIALSMVSRIIQVIGVCVYVRAATIHACNEMGWVMLLCVATLFAIVSPL